MAFDLKQMERDILETAHTLGRIGYFNGSLSPATESLKDKYRSDEEQQQVTVLMKYLLEKRYLFPFFDGKTGKELTDYVRGLTPKGFRRLRELQAPRRVWFEDNWFPVVVAAITAMIGVGSIVVNLIVNRG